MAKSPILMLLALSCATSCATAPSTMVQISPRAPGASASVRGQELYRRGEFALAADAFRRQVRDRPEAAEGYNGLAACYDMLGRFDLAGKYYQLALARAPLDGRIYRNMARSLTMQGRTAEGEAILAEWKAIEGGQIAVASLPDAAEPRTGPAAASTEEPAAVPAASAASRPGPVPAFRPPAQSAGPATQPRARPAAIRVLNASGRRGLAGRVRRHLLDHGIASVQIGTAAEHWRETIIAYPAGQGRRALKLQQALPFRARAVQEPRASRIVVLLGETARFAPSSSRRG